MTPVCLITGAGGRLGQALCRALLGRYEVAAAYRSRVPDVPSQLRRPVAAGASPPAAYCVQADLTRREDVRRLVEVTLARFGRVDAPVNVAADVAFHGRLLDLWPMEEYAAQQLSVNCVAPCLLVSALHHACWKDAPQENACRNRSVVNVSSQSGLYAYPSAGQAVYGASKAALNMLTLYQALELAPYSVRVNALCPGRFMDAATTGRVVDRIAALLAGTATGEVITDP